MKNLTTVSYENVENLNSDFNYRQAVLSLTDSVVYAINEALDCEQISFDKDEIEELVNDSLLHETVDGSQYAIYYHYHLDILKHSSNSEAAINQGILCGDSLSHILTNDGLTGLHQALAFYAMYADVQEEIAELLEQTDFDCEDEDE